MNEIWQYNTLHGDGAGTWTACRVFDVSGLRFGEIPPIPEKGSGHHFCPALKVVDRQVIDKERMLVAVSYA